MQWRLHAPAPCDIGPHPVTDDIDPDVAVHRRAGRSSGEFTMYFDAVALPASDTYPTALQTASSGLDPSTRLWAKTGLWFRPDVAFEIVVPEQLTGRLAAGWGGVPSSPGPGVVHPACPNALHDWVVLAGGYWASQTMCAMVVVRVGDNEQQARIGLGEPCPGQGPPGGPSDK